MNKPASGSVSRSLRRYLRMRGMELAMAATRTATEPLADWALRRIRLDGRPFRFDGHEFLRGIYDDPSAHIVLLKAAQIGGTTWAILRSIHSCLHGLHVMYFFPTRTDVLEFSKSRVSPLIEDNPFLARSMADTDTAGLKRIGSAYIYFRGMQSSVGMKSVPADMVVFDELDEATPAAKTQAKERLSHSSYRRIIELSNPSLPGYGVDEGFQASDQRLWTIRCSACGRDVCLDEEFPKKLGEEVRVIQCDADGRHFRACPKCGTELDVSSGCWVPQFPGRKVAGYRISQLISAYVDPGDILRDYQTTRFPDRFYNLKIGIAWADSQNRLDPMEVLACCGKHGMLESSEERTVMGIDTGSEFHVVISEFLGDHDDRRRVVHIGVHHSFEELDRLVERFNVRTCVIDALPEQHATRAFANRHKRIVWLNFFNEHQRGSPKWTEDQCIVQENRTEALDLSRAQIRRKHVVLPRASDIVQKFAEHLSHDAKRLEEDEETGQQSYKYVRTGTDHFSLAFTYECLAAMKEFGGGPGVGASTPEEPLYRGMLTGIELGNRGHRGWAGWQSRGLDADRE